MSKSPEKTLNDFVDLSDYIQLFVKDPAGVGKLVAELREATLAQNESLGAYNTLEKAEARMRSVAEKERQVDQAMAGIQSKSDEIIRAAEEKAGIITRDANNNLEDTRRLRAETQALKDKAQREDAERDKALTLRREELDARQSELNRREVAVSDQEKSLSEKKRLIDQAMAV